MKCKVIESINRLHISSSFSMHEYYLLANGQRTVNYKINIFHMVQMSRHTVTRINAVLSLRTI